MAGSPIVVDYMQLTVNATGGIARFQRGMTGLYVFGYCQFITNGYSEPPIFINSVKQMVFPKNRRFDSFHWQMKPGVTLSVKPIYGDLDLIAPLVAGEAVNLAKGLASGLRVFLPDGTPGAIPEFVPVIP